MCGNRGAYGLPSCRHDGKAVDEQCWQGIKHDLDRIFRPDPPQIESASHLNKVVFRDAAGASVPGRFLSLFPGLGYAAAYKVCAQNAEREHVIDSARSSNVYTSTVDSPSSGTTWRNTTVGASTAHSARVMERQSCTRPQVPLLELVRSCCCLSTCSRSSVKPTQRPSAVVG